MPELAGAVGPGALAVRVQASPPGLARRRQAAWELYEALPMPSASRDEDWRRTDLGKLRCEDFVADPGRTDHGDALVAHLRALAERVDPQAALLACTRNGVRLATRTEILAEQGITVSSMDDAAAARPEILERALALVAPAASHAEHGDARFAALWQALWRGGVFVHVPAGVEARVPLVAAHSAGGDRAAVFPAVVAVLEAESSLTLVEVCASAMGDAPLLSDAVTALCVGDGARLDHCVLQQWGTGATHIALQRATLGRGARYRTFLATLGGGLQKSWVEALLDGEGAEASIAGTVFGGGRQHLDHQSLQAHRAPNTMSDLLLKVAVRDQARSVYGGLIDVAEAAQKTDGYVQNRNLMLSRGARATGVPRLEIRANDVRCSHGVTAGHIDDDERFYMMTRGVPREDADRLIVRGFMQSALDRCPHPGFAELMGALLDDTVAGVSHAGIGPEEPGAEARR